MRSTTPKSMAQSISLAAMLNDLRDLVEIESPSLDLVALQASAEAVAGMIRRQLGGQPILVESRRGPHVHWSGGGDPKVLILGHHDTVFPVGTLALRPYGQADGLVTGPGVFDMLGGLVQAVHGLGALEDTSGIEILITADEEVGSHTSRTLIEERALACGAVLVMEGAAEGGNLKVARKGCGTFTVTIEGRAAHAGLEPEAGVNALVEAAHQVLTVAGLARPEIGTTVTPTVASAGTADNVVPAQALILVDVRVESAGETIRIESAMTSLAAHVNGAEIRVEGGIGRPPMVESASAALFAIAQTLKPDIKGVAVGGGSDGNFTAALQVSTLDGLGAIGGGAHSMNEHLVADTMVERAELVAGLVAILQRGGLSQGHASGAR